MTYYENYKYCGQVPHPAAFHLFKAYDKFILEADKERLKEAFPEYFKDEFQ